MPSAETALRAAADSLPPGPAAFCGVFEANRIRSKVYSIEWF
ncbi:MAG: hypothetical protein ACM337_07000 [Syntrophaceae bacterium]